MEQITRISFVTLDGETPADLELDKLPPSQAVAQIIERAFRPVSSTGLKFITASGTEPLDDPSNGIHLLYIYGHAWLHDGILNAAPSGANDGLILPVESLLTNLLKTVDLSRLVIILDCCHASAAETAIRPLNNRLTLYGSGIHEKAIALNTENSSRLSLALAEKLAAIVDVSELATICLSVATALNPDGVIRGQTVTVEKTGGPVALKRIAPSPANVRNRTVRRVRNTLIAGGGVVVALLIALGWYVRNHTLVEVDLADLPSIANNIRVIGTLETPSSNDNDVVVEKQVSGSRIRFWVPSDNLVLRIVANFEDGRERALALHKVLQPNFNIFDKTLTWKLPSADKIQNRPNMAHIPATQWIRGRDRDPATTDTPFWIDIRPPTVIEYIAVADKLMQSGQLRADDSFILTARQNSAAVDATGLDQLRSLNSDLGAIFGALEAGTLNEVAAPGDLAAGLGELACDDCPAPMTRQEAELYCETRGMTLPTDTQWELAVRGIDGRTFPWGDQFDHSKANVPGLPDKGDPPAALKPVHDYASELSPFGLYDTVGNAGDWVINTQGAYEAVYMGATYRYNPEDATAFRLLPMTEETSLVREITARCVAR